MSLTERTSGKIFRPISEVWVAPMREGYRRRLRIDNILQITTQKSLSSPTGTFEITMNYDPFHKNSSGIDGEKIRWDNVLSPNDYIEIFLGREKGYPLEIVLRGWIDNVTVSEQAGAQGPTLRITINGRDYGKIWLVTKILSITPALPPIAFVEQYKINYSLTNMVQLFQEVLKKIAEPYVSYHKRINSSVPLFDIDVHNIEPDKDSLALVQIVPDLLMQVVYGILAYYQAKPWIEMFVRDDANSDKPKFILRWSPVRTSDNKQITGLLEPYPEAIIEHEISPIDDIVEDNLTRSDTDTLNWMRAIQATKERVQWSDVPEWNLAGKVPYVIGDSIDMYGLRKSTPKFFYLDNAAGKHKQEIDAAKGEINELVYRFTMWLAEMYGHNYVLLNGSIRVKGLPIYRIGEELVVKNQKGERTQRYYIEGVRQEFIYNQSYRTTLSLSRGMPVNGFANGGLSTMSPYKMPTTFPEGVDTNFITAAIRVDNTPTTPSSPS